MNNQPFIDAEFFMMQENTSMHNPISIVNYEYYTDTNTLKNFIAAEADKLQCIVGTGFDVPNSYDFGTTQSPELWDYADNVDTMEFLLGLGGW